MSKPPSLPKRANPAVPDVFTGKIYENVGKYARGAVLYAFEKVGGADGLAEWAMDNPGAFYTKLFPKIIARETEVHHHRTVDDLMDVIDGDFEVEDADDVPVFDTSVFSVPEIEIPEQPAPALYDLLRDERFDE
jgi:hypothetical protein